MSLPTIPYGELQRAPREGRYIEEGSLELPHLWEGPTLVTIETMDYAALDAKEAALEKFELIAQTRVMMERRRIRKQREALRTGVPAQPSVYDMVEDRCAQSERGLRLVPAGVAAC